jgi:putative transposase
MRPYRRLDYSNVFRFDVHPWSLHTPSMAEHVPLHRVPGRHTPSQGVRISLGEPTIVFLTVCARHRREWMAQPSVRKSLEEVWRSADAWLVGYYLLMPDHLHLFCAPRDLRFTIEQWVRYWKREFTLRHVDQNWEWQRSSFHHRQRTSQEYQNKWQYVRENPIRKGLVADPDDWPYSGMIHELRW